MKKFNENHFDILKAYIEKSNDLLNSLVDEQDRERIEAFLSQDCSDYDSTKTHLLLQSISDDILARIYVKKKYEGTLSDLFLDYQENIMNLDDSPELLLMYDYMGRFYEEDAIFEKEYAVAEYQLLINDNELWKLFEDESSTQIYIPIAI